MDDLLFFWTIEDHPFFSVGRHSFFQKNRQMGGCVPSVPIVPGLTCDPVVRIPSTLEWELLKIQTKPICVQSFVAGIGILVYEYLYYDTAWMASPHLEVMDPLIPDETLCSTHEKLCRHTSSEDPHHIILQPSSPMCCIRFTHERKQQITSRKKSAWFGIHVHLPVRSPCENGSIYKRYHHPVEDLRNQWSEKLPSRLTTRESVDCSFHVSTDDFPDGYLLWDADPGDPTTGLYYTTRKNAIHHLCLITKIHREIVTHPCLYERLPLIRRIPGTGYLILCYMKPVWRPWELRIDLVCPQECRILQTVTYTNSKRANRFDLADAWIHIETHTLTLLFRHSGISLERFLLSISLSPRLFAMTRCPCGC